jgi:hypothetical protein
VQAARSPLFRDAEKGPKRKKPEEAGFLFF